MEESASEGGRLPQYEALVAVIEAGNLTAAAKRLGRSLQSVSRALAALEEQLGVVLVRRTTRRAEPTEAGLAFAARVRSALGEIRTAEAEVRESSGALKGPVRLAASAYFAGRYVAAAIAEFTQRHPLVRFDLRIAEHFASHVGEGIDAMIRAGALPSSPLKARKIATLRRVAVASPSYLARAGRPEVPQDLARHACVVRATAQDKRTWTFHAQNGAAVRVVVDGPCEADNAFVTNHAAAAGLGVAIAPFFQVRDLVEAGALEIVLADFTLAPLPVHAILPADVRTPTRVRRFIDLLAHRLKREAL